MTVLVTLAAGVGAVCRYLVDVAVQRRTTASFPAGTWVVNLSGSLLLGLLVGLTAHHGFATSASTVLGAGFAGGYTTLSTWSWETIALAERGERTAAMANVAGSLALGMAAGAAGLGLALLG